ncbi:MAG: TSUP family transporter [Xanthomonadaceae bacterium]|jgi:uncharacterized membrane protein YfcA|nr:TSUP family transporter [Xanthomonadaceae bacterium]
MPFEPTLSIPTIAILAAVAFLAGFIDAIAGGGGLLTIPALLTAGIPPHLALGTNKLGLSFSSLVSSTAFYRRGLFRPSQWRNGILATVAGALAGAATVHWIAPEWLNRILPIIVLLCGAYMLIDRSPRSPPDAGQITHRWRQWPQGGVLGFYDGIIGAGTGTFWTVSSLLLYPLDLLHASGVARVMSLVSAAAALTVFIGGGNVDWALGLSMGAALMLGSFIGSRIAIDAGSRFIHPVFLIVTLAMAVNLIWHHWSGRH